MEMKLYEAQYSEYFSLSFSSIVIYRRLHEDLLLLIADEELVSTIPRIKKSFAKYLGLRIEANLNKILWITALLQSIPSLAWQSCC